VAKRKYVRTSTRIAVAVIGVFLLLPFSISAAGGSSGNSSPALFSSSRDVADPEALRKIFQAAAEEFTVPLSVVQAVSFLQSRWEHHDGQPSTSGGCGVMHLTDVDPEDLLPQQNDIASSAPDLNDPALHTRDQAATLLDVDDPDALCPDVRQNIRGGVALLAQYAREISDGELPAKLGDWVPAVVRYSGARDEAAARLFAEDFVMTLRGGQSRTTSDGQVVRLTAQADVELDLAGLIRLKLRLSKPPAGVECPRDLDCQFIPAVAENYDAARRPDGMKIHYIVLHVEEGYDQGTISWFQNPASQVSAHYVVRSSDGRVTQMVRTRDIARHAGNWSINMHGIGIEQEGFALEGATWFSEPMYRSTARLVRYLADRFDVPLDRGHIIDSNEVPPTTPERVRLMHWDTGPLYDWQHIMELVKAPISRSGEKNSGIVTITPDFATNRPNLTTCYKGPCRELPSQPANFVYLRTEPRADASLISDPAFPAGASGTTNAEDISDKAAFGQQFAVADRKGDWTAIHYGGQLAWFYDPSNQRTSTPTTGKLVTPRSDLNSISVYGRAYPEASAYQGTEVPVQEVVPLPYSIPAGQRYVSFGSVPADYYYAKTVDASLPGERTLVKGKEHYLLISFNHRLAFVKASDVASVLDPK